MQTNFHLESRLTRGLHASTGKGAVLLINPRMSPRRKARFPLSLLHLSAVLEGRRPWSILDETFEDDLMAGVRSRLDAQPHAMVGVTVMPGPAVAPAIAISAAIRREYPSVPIVWGGYFPTLYADAAINASYVDFVVRGQGEHVLLDLLEHLDGDGRAIGDVKGVTWKRDGIITHNPEGPTIAPSSLPRVPYEGLGDVGRFLRPSFMGRRTAVYQAAIGCRYKCEFCGVVSMWNGKTQLDAPTRVLEAGTLLRDRWGADALQFFDHNFFDKEESSIPLLEALGKLALPWWCYARVDTVANFSAATWEKVRKSKLRMAYFGAESGTDLALALMKKGTSIDQTSEVVKRCREIGVVPELSFILGGPKDPEGEIERTFAFIRHMKTMNPDAEIVLYFYSPTPQRPRGAKADGSARLPVLATYGPSGPSLPKTPEEWTERKWVDWVCHRDAPWLTEAIRQRVKDFARVLACRFPTSQDISTPAWGKSVLRRLAMRRYENESYERPWELSLAQRVFRLRDPKEESL